MENYQRPVGMSDEREAIDRDLSRNPGRLLRPHNGEADISCPTVTRQNELSRSRTKDLILTASEECEEDPPWMLGRGGRCAEPGLSGHSLPF